MQTRVAWTLLSEPRHVTQLHRSNRSMNLRNSLREREKKRERERYRRRKKDKERERKREKEREREKENDEKKREVKRGHSEGAD